MKHYLIEHEFVEFIPEVLQPGKLYISVEYGMAAHLCCCGCGYEVSNPITPTDWSLIFDGATVSLRPSIGNSSFPCRSHYWIDHNRVDWEDNMTSRLTAASRSRDKTAKARHFAKPAPPSREDLGPNVGLREADSHSQVEETWLGKVRKHFIGSSDRSGE